MGLGEENRETVFESMYWVGHRLNINEYKMYFCQNKYNQIYKADQVQIWNLKFQKWEYGSPFLFIIQICLLIKRGKNVIFS